MTNNDRSRLGRWAAVTGEPPLLPSTPGVSGDVESLLGAVVGLAVVVESLLGAVVGLAVVVESRKLWTSDMR